MNTTTTSVLTGILYWAFITASIYACYKAATLYRMHKALVANTTSSQAHKENSQLTETDLPKRVSATRVEWMHLDSEVLKAFHLAVSATSHPTAAPNTMSPAAEVHLRKNRNFDDPNMEPELLSHQLLNLSSYQALARYEYATLVKGFGYCIKHVEYWRFEREQENEYVNWKLLDIGVIQHPYEASPLPTLKTV